MKIQLLAQILLNLYTFFVAPAPRLKRKTSYLGAWVLLDEAYFFMQVSCLVAMLVAETFRHDM